MTTGAGAGALTARAGAGAWDREGAGRRGAGSARRGGRGAGRGAVTVTSGSVSDTWPQTGPGEVSSPENVNAPKATAPNSRRFKPTRRNGLRLAPPNIVAPRHQIPRRKFNPSKRLLGTRTFVKVVGNFVQCLREYRNTGFYNAVAFWPLFGRNQLKRARWAICVADGLFR